MKIGFLQAALLMFSHLIPVGSALASHQVGSVEWINIRESDGLVYFAISGDHRSEKPTCATNGYWMIRNENSPAGRRQIALLTAAFVAKKNVSVTGYHQCTRWADGEDVNAISVHQ
jgi:hypothetical protein